MSQASLRRPRLLTLPEVADQLKVSTKTLRRWVDPGDLRVHRLGRQLRIAEEDLQPSSAPGEPSRAVHEPCGQSASAWLQRDSADRRPRQPARPELPAMQGLLSSTGHECPKPFFPS
jgi:excisionase family DNA binding protein